jgi:hypothetical protein
MTLHRGAGLGGGALVAEAVVSGVRGDSEGVV